MTGLGIMNRECSVSGVAVTAHVALKRITSQRFSRKSQLCTAHLSQNQMCFTRAMVLVIVGSVLFL